MLPQRALPLRAATVPTCIPRLPRAVTWRGALCFGVGYCMPCCLLRFHSLPTLFIIHFRLLLLLACLVCLFGLRDALVCLAGGGKGRGTRMAFMTSPLQPCGTGGRTRTDSLSTYPHLLLLRWWWFGHTVHVCGRRCCLYLLCAFCSSVLSSWPCVCILLLPLEPSLSVAC